jgi:hypothetical protein
MKKSQLKAIPIGKQILVATVLSAIGFACTQSANRDLEGTFTGSDGSNQTPSQVDWVISVAGDGLISGTWASKGEVTKGQLSGKFGTFGNELILYAQSGNCTGQFHGDFKLEKDELKGTLQGNNSCPDRSYHFDLKKGH